MPRAHDRAGALKLLPSLLAVTCTRPGTACGGAKHTGEERERTKPYFVYAHALKPLTYSAGVDEGGGHHLRRVRGGEPHR